MRLKVAARQARQTRTPTLQKCYESERDAVRELGELVRRYISRINVIYACETVGDLQQLPQLGFHALKGDRAGHFAISLSGNMRLIVSIHQVGGETVVRVEEVSSEHCGRPTATRESSASLAPELAPFAVRVG